MESRKTRLKMLEDGEKNCRREIERQGRKRRKENARPNSKRTKTREASVERENNKNNNNRKRKTKMMEQSRKYTSTRVSNGGRNPGDEGLA